MTITRVPHTVEAALARIAGQLAGDWAKVATVARRKPSTVYGWGNPGSTDYPPIDCAIRLDVAFQKAGGVGAPLRDVYDYLLDRARGDEFGCQIELARVTAAVVKEVGEAGHALILATLPGADDTQFAVAEREVVQGVGAMTSAIEALKRLRRKRGPPG